MTVIELARRTGISPTAIRFYRRAGILPPPHPVTGGGRGYDQADALKLAIAVGFHRLGIGMTPAPPAPSAAGEPGAAAAPAAEA